MKTIELFAGAGGMALGVEQAGFRHQALVEFDACACKTLRFNRSEWPILEADVRDVDFRAHAGADLLTAGAPCQPFSTAGERRLDDDHRNMFPEVLRAVRMVRPRSVLLENVSGMLKGSARDYFDFILTRLTELGYSVRWRLVNCADHGVPQRRERVFIIAFRSELGVRWTWPEPTHGEDALLHAQWSDGSYWQEQGLPEPDSMPRRQLESLERIWPSQLPPSRRRWLTVRDALADLQGSLRDGQSYGDRHYGDRQPHTWDEPAKTITTRWHAAMLRCGSGLDRYLSLRELARLQTFPDEWAFAGRPDEQLRQIGNAVPVEMARILAEAIAKALSARDNAQTAAVNCCNSTGYELAHAASGLEA
jgi:DNA (cytosine-5)-methyltransferase 1